MSNMYIDTPFYYQKRYGLIFYRQSGEIMYVTDDTTTLRGDSTEGLYLLSKIVLDKNVQDVVWNGLGRWSFDEFEVSEENEVFQTREGVLYTKEGYDRHGKTNRKKMIELVACPTNVNTHDIMYGTRRIANCAFKGSHVSSLYIPDSVEEIGTNAFYFADNLKTIEIPLSLKKLEPQISRTPLIIRYCGKEFDSWNNLFAYLLDNGFECKSYTIVKGK